MEGDFRAVRPSTPPAAYVGGKRMLAPRLVALIDRVPHRVYAEPFVGMGGVFLRRSRVPPSEVINDRARDVAVLFRVLQRHYTAFLDMLRFQLSTRAEFERLQGTDPDMLTDLERAARFLSLQRLSFGGRVAGRSFGVSPGTGGRFNVTRLEPILEAVHERLAGVVIECLPFADFLARYDRPEVLFYVDPPYWGCEADYGRDLFGRADHARLAAALDGLRGRFIVSINDRPETREIYGRFPCCAVEVTYHINRDSARQARELIVSNAFAPGFTVD